MSSRPVPGRNRDAQTAQGVKGLVQRVRAAHVMHWGIAFAVIVIATAWLMRNWLWPYIASVQFPERPLPTSSRREVLTEMAIVWMFKQELSQGHLLSEWNPYWFSGFPWLRFLSYPLYYLVAALALVTEMSLDQTLVAYYFVVMFGSGFAMYLYLRRVLSRSGAASAATHAAALVGAVIYEALPYHNHVGVETWIHAAFWVVLPLALWAIELAPTLGKRAPIASIDMDSAIAPESTAAHAASTRWYPIIERMPRLLMISCLLALFPIISSEYALIAGPFVALYLLVHELAQDEPAGAEGHSWITRWWSRLEPALVNCAVVGVVAVGLAAFFLLPGYIETQYVGIHAKHAQGSTFTDELLRNYSVTPRLLWYAIGQRLHLPSGLRLAVTDPALPGIVRSFWGITWYPGIVAATLALVGLSAVRRHLAAALALGGLLLSLLMASGPTFSLNFVTYLPVFGRLSPFRSLLITGLFMSVLAAYGARWLFAHLRSVFGRWASVAPQPYGSRSADIVRRASRGIRASLPWSMAALLVVLVLLDFAPASGAYQTTDAYFSKGEKDAYAWLSDQTSSGRVWEASELPRDQYLRSVSLLELSTPRYVGYYDNGAPLHTWQQMAWSDLETVLYLHRVRYVLLREGDAITARLRPQLYDASYAVAHEAEGVQIWENPDNAAYGRFYGTTALDVGDDFFLSFQALSPLVSRGIALVATDTARGISLREKSLRALDPDDPASWPFDYLLIDKQVIRSEGTEIILPHAHRDRYLTAESLDQLPTSPVMDAWIWPERLSWDEIHVEAEVPARGVLTISESWYPHWRAEVDGEPRPVLRVNWALMGVQLEPGLHRVRFRFQRPWYVFLGYAISLLTVSIIALMGTRYLTQKLYQPRIMASEVYLLPERDSDSTA